MQLEFKLTSKFVKQNDLIPIRPVQLTMALRVYNHFINLSMSLRNFSLNSDINHLHTSQFDTRRLEYSNVAEIE